MVWSFYRFGPLLALCLSLGSAVQASDLAASAGAPVKLLVSSQPLALLLGEILPPSAGLQLDLLVAPGASLHHPSLRPSQRAAIADAQRVIWLGPRLEPGLARYLNAVPEDRLVTLEELADMELLQLGTGHVDSHVWLSPENAIQIARVVPGLMSDLDISLAGLNQNMSDFISGLEADMQLASKRFASLNDNSFIAVHDAFAYLSDYFQLEQLGALIDANDQPVGARTLWGMQQRIKPGADICLLDNARYPAGQSEALAQYAAFHKVSVDLSGANYQPGKGAYRRYLNSIIESLYLCLLANSNAGDP